MGTTLLRIVMLVAATLIAAHQRGLDLDKPVRVYGPEGKLAATLDDENESFAHILRHQGQSVAYATRYGGWGVLVMRDGRWQDVTREYHEGYEI